MPMNCFVLAVTVIIAVNSSRSSLALDGGDSLLRGGSLVGNQTIISKNGTFELGFFSPRGSSTNQYIGIWYARLSPKVIVWVANRDNPVKGMPGVLKFSSDGHLRVLDGKARRSVWSTDRGVKGSKAMITDYGNLIMLLVYAYMPNGSLNSSLFSVEKDRVLDWNTRFQIALGTARGLVYLHEECRDQIIHCDIKPENILLDGTFSPKIADFGLAKLVGRDFSRVLTTTRGTRGYLAPEWISGLPITPKVDVYSFGMTLLEIISGRRNLDLKVEESRFYFPT